VPATRVSAGAGARGGDATEESGGRREHQEERNLTAVLLVVSPEPGKAGNGGELAWPETRKTARFGRLGLSREACIDWEAQLGEAELQGPSPELGEARSHGNLRRPALAFWVCCEVKRGEEEKWR
jgi:hypothetical protein